MTNNEQITIPEKQVTLVRFHSFAWITWLGAAVVASSTTRNPLYLLLILLCLIIVNATLQSTLLDTQPLLVSPVKFAVFVTLVTALFNTLTTHYGQTVLFHLPAFLPLLGGKVTLEAWGYGLINGLIISCLFTAFTILNLALPIRTILRYIPRAFHPLAVVISIAVTFVPTTLRQFQHIREAQAVRGHRIRGLRDWVPLFLPLLIGGLEHALQLAEAMTARGFASSRNTSHTTHMQTTLVVGLALILGGWLLRLGWGQNIIGLLLMFAGGALVIGIIWLASRRVPHTVYRREHWYRHDTVTLVAAVVVLLVFLTLVPGVDRKALYYAPYPLLQVPGFHIGIGVAILGLLAPAFIILTPYSGKQ